MKALCLMSFLCIMAMPQEGFKSNQLKSERVAQAQEEKGQIVADALKLCGIGDDAFELYLIAYKVESELELWVKAEDKSAYTLLKSYAICAKSGALGPKRKQGDFQVPEGFYHIDRFNPWSNYHLSLGINYPNASDRILSDKQRPGGDIFIHGNCVTVGCLPMTDEYMKEIYLFCLEAKDRGAGSIPVTIYPRKMSPVGYAELQDMPESEAVKSLWSDLKSAYDYFHTDKTLPHITFKSDGSHEIKAAK